MQFTVKIFSGTLLGKIKELFGKSTINSGTVLVLVNAVYFKAKWERYFEVGSTVEAPFCLREVLY